MPEIGNPNQARNPFRNIGIKRPAGSGASRSEQARARDVGASLNRLAGVAEDSQFVDRAKHNQLDKDAFLRLLSAQLGNQDPFNPVDQKKFAADLAQFSQLEQLANLNSKFDKTNMNAPHELKSIGASFIGKEVLTKGTSISHDGESRSTNLPFYLPKASSKVIVRIFDSSNNLVRQLEKDGMGQGGQSVNWDGYAMDGTPAVKDNYRFDVKGWDSDYNEFQGETKAKGLVTGVRFEGEEMILEIDHKKKVFLRDVDSFSAPRAKQNMLGAKNPHLKKTVTNAYNHINDQQQ